MKFQLDQPDGTNAISRHGEGQVWVGSTRYAHSVLVPWTGAVVPWAPATVQDLTRAHFDAVLALEPALVIFGSGARQRFVAPALLRALIDRRIGVETMDTAAACRTFNVLAGEGRLVVAALLLPRQAAGATGRAA